MDVLASDVDALDALTLADEAAAERLPDEVALLETLLAAALRDDAAADPEAPVAVDATDASEERDANAAASADAEEEEAAEADDADDADAAEAAEDALDAAGPEAEPVADALLCIDDAAGVEPVEGDPTDPFWLLDADG